MARIYLTNLVRLAHFHAVLDQRDPLPDVGVALANFASVDSFASVVVDGVRAGGAEIGVIHGEVVHLGVELIEPI